MKKEQFSQLLTDLYQAYNPDYVQYVPQLVERYSGIEFAAVEMVIIKYNRKNASFYDPEKDSNEYKLALIKDYSEGKRTLQGLKLEEIQKEDKNAAENKKLQENINKTIEELANDFSKKEKAYEEQIEELKKLASAEPRKSGLYDDIEIKIISNYTENQVKLPNKDTLVGLGVGARIITSTPDGSKVIGLKVVDIIYDCVSDFNGKQIIEIILDKE